MKKIYKTPKVEVLSFAPELMNGLPPSSIGGKISVDETNNDTGTTEFGFGGNGGGSIRPEAKGNGRGFWDDED